MAKHLLTDRKVRTARPKVAPYRLHDGDGLALLVSPTGAKSWQYRYKMQGTEGTATLGKLDRVSLADARAKRDEAHKLVDQGKDPTIEKRLTRANHKAATARTFKTLAAAWIESESRRKGWTPDYREEVIQSLANHLHDLDALPVSRIVAAITSPMLNLVERHAPEMEPKVSRRLNAIMDYAVEQGAIIANPLPRRRRAKRDRKHYPAVTKLPGIGAILRTARGSDPCKGIQRAHLLLAFTAMRVSEVVGAAWSEFDLTAGEWAIERERMKRKDEARGPHVVPLPPALLAGLREWHEIDGGGALYVCPAPRDPTKPITPEAVEKFYRNALDLGGKHSPHSWRSAFSTVCREAGKDGDAVESQLDHVVGTAVASSYDRAKRLELRRALMTWYEQQLLAARDGATVLPIERRTSK